MRETLRRRSMLRFYLNSSSKESCARFESIVPRALVVAHLRHDLVDAKQMLCTKVDPKSAGIPADDVYAGSTDDSYKFCFVDPDHKER